MKGRQHGRHFDIPTPLVAPFIRRYAVVYGPGYLAICPSGRRPYDRQSYGDAFVFGAAALRR